METVELYLRGALNGPCLILPGKTGIIYTNQTDGIMCNHPELEGTLIKLHPAPGSDVFNPNRWYLSDMQHFSDETVQEIETALRDCYQSDQVEDIRIIREARNEEAWVWVECDVKGEGRQRAILTWENSD